MYVTVTDYTADKAVRIFFWDKYQNKRIDYYLKPEADKETANFEAATNITGNGTYCVKVPDGARLQGAKPAWGSSSSVSFKFSEIYLTERATPYVEVEPYTLVYSEGSANIPISESHIRTTGNVSINYSTGVVTNTGSGKLIIYLNNEDLVGATRYVADVTDSESLEPTLEVADAVNGEVGGIYGSRYNWNIAGDASRNTKIGSVTALRYDFSKAGSMTIKSLDIYANELIAETTQNNLADMPYGSWELPANKVSNYIAADGSKTNNIGKGDKDLIYGHDGVGDVYKYVDLTNCTKIIFTGLSSNGQLRLFYNWDGTEDGKSTATITDFPTTSGTYEFDIEAFKKSKSITFFHLNGIKATYGQTANITAIKVNEYTNVISGSGIDRTKNYLLNPYITSIDATGLTNTSAIELTSANPNCLFIANSGKLSNANNVIVDGTCVNLALTDGNPFKAPSEFTATATSYTGRSFTADKTTTVCLPFALTSTEAATLGTFYELDSFSGSTLNFTSVDAPSANTPYLVVPTNTSLTLSEADKTIAATPADVATSITNVEFIGTLAATGVPASDAEYSYYAYNNGDFVKIETKAATLPAFRGYFKVATTAISGARLAARFVGGSVTGINEVSEAQGFNNFEGKVFENGKIVIYKKGMKFNANGARLK